MSAHVPYDPALFVFERATAVTAELGAFILGASRLGATSTTWLPVPMASFTYSEDYSVNEAGVLIYGSEAATVSLSYWGNPAATPLYPGDRVRASYDEKVLFLGTVDRTTMAARVSSEAVRHGGATHRCDFEATLVGTYAAALATPICLTYRPGETAMDRITDYVTVEGPD